MRKGEDAMAYSMRLPPLLVAGCRTRPFTVKPLNPGERFPGWVSLEDYVGEEPTDPDAKAALVLRRDGTVARSENEWGHAAKAAIRAEIESRLGLVERRSTPPK